MNKPQDQRSAEERVDQAPARRPYQKPALQAYGDLAEITKGIVGTKTNDGSGHPNKHFTS